MLADKLVAHRGWQKVYPENTLLSIAKAIEAGAHYIETDILFSADRQPVLYHDLSLRRVSGREGTVDSLDLASLERIPAYEPKRFANRFLMETIAPLTTITLLLKANPKVTLFVEAKQEGIDFMGQKAALNTIIQTLAPVRRQCVLISYNLDFVLAARQANWPRLGVVLKNWRTLSQPVMPDIHPEFVFCSERHIPKQVDLELEESALVVYEVADPERAIEWFRRGVDMVETFDIGGMLHQLAHRAL